MDKILNHVKQFLINIDYSPANKGMRIIYFVIFLAAVFSGLNIHTSKMRLESEIGYATHPFTLKEPSLMKSIIRECQGDIGDSSVVAACVEDTKEKTLAPIKSELFKYKVLSFFWAAFWITLATCLIILGNNKHGGEKPKWLRIASRFFDQK